MSGMRLVGLLMLGLGLLVIWEVLRGQRPQDHVQQLVDLFGHQHVSGQSPSAAMSSGAPAVAGAAGGGGNFQP
ncbi:MAG TPA: hypothetical protein VJX92_15530 [Methylomirabilota bacterium]|nr:hypothetical protein [Methylomirabilota bacterium]